MKRLIKKSKLGRAPATIEDIKTFVRQKLDNPTLLQSKLKDIVDRIEDFNDDQFQNVVNNYLDNPSDGNFNSLISYLAPLVNRAIDLRRQRAEQILRDNKYIIKGSGSYYKIVNHDDSNEYTVDLNNETCTCPDYARMGWFQLWCKHLYTVFLLKNNIDDIT